MNQSHLSFILLIVVVCAAVGIGLGVGLSSNNVPVPTQTLSSRPPPTVPCNSSYTLQLDNTINFYPGDYANYYVAGDILVYYSSNATSDLYLIARNRTSGNISWSNQICTFDSQYVQSIAIDQRNGDVYFAFMCTASAYVNKYNTNGVLQWSSNVTTINGTITQYEAPIQLDTMNSQVYIAFSASIGSKACALLTSNGTVAWCTSTSVTSGEVGGMTFHANTHRLYLVDSIQSTNISLYKYDTMNGNFITSTNVPGIKLGEAPVCDSTGNIFVSGTFPTSPSVMLLVKYDASLTKLWSVTFGNSSGIVEYDSNSFNVRSLLYDTVEGRIIASGSVRTAPAVPDERPWIATLNSTDGSQLSYYERTVPNSGWVSLVPFYESYTVFYTYMTNASTFTYSLNTYCY
jgi:6-phosphogluconolactonase (cycloisomerase 2 family)